MYKPAGAAVRGRYDDRVLGLLGVWGSEAADDGDEEGIRLRRNRE